MPALLTEAPGYEDTATPNAPHCYGAELHLKMQNGNEVHCCMPGAIRLVESLTSEARQVVEYMLRTEEQGSVGMVQFASESLGQHECELHDTAR